MTRAGRPTATTSLGSSRPGWDQGAFAEEDAVTEPAAGHEDGGIADFAQVAHGGADHQAAMTEDRTPADRRGHRGGADDHAVLDHR